jgi:thioredoxin reductase (NADPH)
MAQRALSNSKIKFAWNSAVDQVNGEGKVSSLTLRDLNTGETSDLAVTGMFVAIGHDPRNELIRDQITLDEEGYVVVDAPHTRTNLAGVFAAGDLVDHTYRQAITAAASGCAAAIDVERYLEDLSDA